VDERLTLPQHATRKSTDRSLRTMHQIGTELIHTAHERLAHSGEASTDFDFREKSRLDNDVAENKTSGGSDQIWPRARREEALKGRDLLSLLSTS
jgi:hypothetical protein